MKFSAELYLFLYYVVLFLVVIVSGDNSNEEEEETVRHKIEGKILIHGMKQGDWIAQSKVLVDGGKFIAFLKSDGSFVINNMLPGTYIVEVVTPNYLFDPVRVDISGKGRGKIRARKVNFIQNSAVSTVPYPLKFKTKDSAHFFEKRESWKWTDFLFNPMVIMMVLPLIVLVALPKLMSNADPETQKEMQNMNLFPPSKDLPEMSDMFTWLFGDGAKKKTSKSGSKKAVMGKRR